LAEDGDGLFVHYTAREQQMINEIHLRFCMFANRQARQSIERGRPPGGDGGSQSERVGIGEQMTLKNTLVERYAKRYM